MFQEAAADLTEVWLLLVELLLQAFQKLPLEPVDVFNVAKDGTKLLLSEHVGPLAALFDVTLRGNTVRVRTCCTDFYLQAPDFILGNRQEHDEDDTFEQYNN